MTRRRPTTLCRSWLFAPGAEATLLHEAATCGADVIIQELEDFTPRDRRAEARALAPGLYPHWRSHGVVTAVRINPYADEGQVDLAAVMAGAPDIVALPKVTTPDHISALDADISAHETALGLPQGSTEILPNIESAAGLIALRDIARASARVTACLIASEDMAADLGAPRQPDNHELQYARQRFFFECAAVGVLAVDYPHTWSDPDTLERDIDGAARLGYRAKSCVMAAHASVINAGLSPPPAATDRAKRIVAAFETAQANGRSNIQVDGILVELPTYNTALRLLKRACALAEWDDA